MPAIPENIVCEFTDSKNNHWVLDDKGIPWVKSKYNHWAVTQYFHLYTSGFHTCTGIFLDLEVYKEVVDAFYLAYKTIKLL